MTDSRQAARHLTELVDHINTLARRIPTLLNLVNAPQTGGGETGHVDIPGPTDQTGTTVARNLAAGNHSQHANDPPRPWPPHAEAQTALRHLADMVPLARGATAAISRALDRGASPDDIVDSSCTHCGGGPYRRRQLRDGLCPACYQYRRRTGGDRPQHLIDAELRRDT